MEQIRKLLMVAIAWSVVGKSWALHAFKNIKSEVISNRDAGSETEDYAWVIPNEGENCDSACENLTTGDRWECDRDAMCDVNTASEMMSLVSGWPKSGVTCSLTFDSTETIAPYHDGTTCFYVGISLGCHTLCKAKSPGGPADDTARMCACCEKGTCKVMEDPHIEVFDGTQVSLLQASASKRNGDSAGDMWLVKTDVISIQARYRKDATLPDRNLFVQAVAVGGAFVKDNVIIIGSLEDQITWNGVPVLEDVQSSFVVREHDYYIAATRSENSTLVQNLKQTNPGVNIEFPSGVTLVVNRLAHHVNLAIKMKKPRGNQDGLCGNFNGVASDDTLELSSKRWDPRVPAEESLFAGWKF